MEINKTTLSIAAGVAGSLFLGYCIYFDKKRRNDPEYKKKVHDRRRRQKKTAHSDNSRELPNFKDHDSVQRFFLQEIQLGEGLIMSGDIEGGVEHLANAVIVCGQPAQLLQVLQQTLPSQVFTLLIQRMKEVGNKAPSAGGESMPGPGGDHPKNSITDMGSSQLMEESTYEMVSLEKPTDSSEKPATGAITEQDVASYLLREAQLGEDLILSGDVEGGVEHLVNAISVSTRPSELLQALQQTLPTPVFALIIKRMKEIGEFGGEEQRKQLEDAAEN